MLRPAPCSAAALLALALAGCRCERGEAPRPSKEAPQGWKTTTLGERDASASGLQLVVDARGRALSAFVSVGVRGSEVVVAEERLPLAFDARVVNGALPLGLNTADPSIAVGPNGQAFVAWRVATPAGARVYTAERDEAGRWRDADPDAPLSLPPAAYNATAAYGKGGELIVAWLQQHESGRIGVALAHRPPGGELARPSRSDDVLSPPINFANGSMVVADAQGHAFVTWYQSPGGPLAVFVSERPSAEGAFSRPAPSDVLSPRLTEPEDPWTAVAHSWPALGPRGELCVVWRGVTRQPKMAVFLAERSAEGAWRKPERLDDSFSEPADRVDHVRAVLAPAGDLFVVWQEHRGDDIAVMLAHRAPDGAWRAGGRDPLRLNAAGSRGIGPVIAAGVRRVAVAWTELHPIHWRVRVRLTSTARSEPAEAARWTDADELGAPGSNATSPAIAVGKDDRAVVAWLQAGRVHVAARAAH